MIMANGQKYVPHQMQDQHGYGVQRSVTKAIRERPGAEAEKPIRYVSASEAPCPQACFT